MKDTALSGKHKELGARIVSFAGYNMPLEYSGVRDEHLNVRNRLGLFDVSHMGEFWIKGKGSTELIQKLTTNDIHRLVNGKIQYNCFPNGKGGIIDDLLIYRYEDEKYMLVVNASNIEKDWNWISKNNSEGALMDNASDEMSMIAVQGPLAAAAMQKLCNRDLASMKYYNFETLPVGTVGEVIVSATGYTGAGGFELYCLNKDASGLWDSIMDAGKEFGIKPAGLAARDTLRLEMGYCLYGNDIDETTSPVEAGLGWITKFSEGNDFIDRARLEEQQTKGTSRKLVGFKMIDRGIPRRDYEIFDDTGNLIGKVTSGTISPMLNTGIGMGYVQPAFAETGSRVRIRIRKKDLTAEVVTLPFYRKEQK